MVRARSTLPSSKEFGTDGGVVRCGQFLRQIKSPRVPELLRESLLRPVVMFGDMGSLGCARDDSFYLADAIDATRNNAKGWTRVNESRFDMELRACKITRQVFLDVAAFSCCS